MDLSKHSDKIENFVVKVLDSWSFSEYGDSRHTNVIDRNSKTRDEFNRIQTIVVAAIRFGTTLEKNKMIRGKTEAETLKLNGWGVGDILEGDEGHGPDRVKITTIGEEGFLCRWDYKCKDIWSEEKGNTTLTCREWKKIN